MAIVFCLFLFLFFFLDDGIDLCNLVYFFSMLHSKVKYKRMKTAN